jgi:hypothetical protein
LALGELGVPYAVKVHGSALEYVVKRDPERFLPWAREGLAAIDSFLTEEAGRNVSLGRPVVRANSAARQYADT